MTTRTHTPDRVTVDEHGRKTTTIKVQRACNGCGQYLGDPDNRDVDQHGELTDVRGECQHCRPLVELEAQGCTTWQILRRDLAELADSLKGTGVDVTAVTEDSPDGMQFIGVRVGVPPGVVARFGDWIIRHPDGGFTVHKAPATEAGR